MSNCEIHNYRKKRAEKKKKIYKYDRLYDVIKKPPKEMIDNEEFKIKKG